MTCRTCGASVPPAIAEFGGVVISRQPDRCHGCRASASSRLAEAQLAAQEEARSDGSNLPVGVVVFPGFVPVVDEAWGLTQGHGLVWATGDPGSGKTVLAFAVGKRALEVGWTVRYEHASVLADKAGWANRQLWSEVDLLIVDALFDARSALPPWILDHIDSLLQVRHDAGRHTLVTSVRNLAGIGAYTDVTMQRRLAAQMGADGAITLPVRRAGR